MICDPARVSDTSHWRASAACSARSDSRTTSSMTRRASLASADGSAVDLRRHIQRHDHGAEELGLERLNSSSQTGARRQYHVGDRRMDGPSLIRNVVVARTQRLPRPRS